MSVSCGFEIGVGKKDSHTAVRGGGFLKQYYIYTLTTVNVGDIIYTSLGGENHGIQRRCQKNKGAHK